MCQSKKKVYSLYLSHFIFGYKLEILEIIINDIHFQCMIFLQKS